MNVWSNGKLRITLRQLYTPLLDCAIPYLLLWNVYWGKFKAETNHCILLTPKNDLEFSYLILILVNSIHFMKSEYNFPMVMGNTSST